jgi:hypothetical protein
LGGCGRDKTDKKLKFAVRNTDMPEEMKAINIAEEIITYLERDTGIC